ncbi:Uncharacterised protein [Bordetella pertussis]|nr:Uncharacterised protein [Bordetella pertussis]CFW36057.1 Uncharacterised protein [Bordetella pertussis]
MFCTGAAPTVPGIRARFSSPSQPLSTQAVTKPCQFSPAAASTTQASAHCPTRRTPGRRTCATRPSMLAGNTTLLPPPSTTSWRKRGASADSAGSCEGSVSATKAGAWDARPRVLKQRKSCAWGARGATGSIRAGTVDMDTVGYAIVFVFAHLTQEFE